jgi:precorrin-8X/cobalt-precorrin-8 methylmutase
MVDRSLTIKELTDAVGCGISPRMVRHYHQLGLLPQPVRSSSNYRLYNQRDVQRLQRIVALKQQGFQLSHIHKLLESEPATDTAGTLMMQLQQQYRSIIQQISHLRQTASALEGLLGRDQQCQHVQAEAIAQLKLLEVETQTRLGGLEQLWSGLDAAVHAHPEAFQESLERLLPDLSDRSEIEVDLLSKLVLACGDVSLVPFVKVGKGAIAASRNALNAGCRIVADVPIVHAALDQTRLAHLGCTTETLVDDCHITSAAEAEQAFWQHSDWKARLRDLPDGCIMVVGYAPSVLFAVCEAIATQQLRPALVIGMPIGFSHAPAAKRQLMQIGGQVGMPLITLEGTIGGGLLATVALNAIAASLIEKPDCHCYLSKA